MLDCAPCGQSRAMQGGLGWLFLNFVCSFCLLEALGLELRALGILSKCSTHELHSQPFFGFHQETGSC